MRRSVLRSAHARQSVGDVGRGLGLTGGVVWVGTGAWPLNGAGLGCSGALGGLERVRGGPGGSRGVPGVPGGSPKPQQGPAGSVPPRSRCHPPSVPRRCRCPRARGGSPDTSPVAHGAVTSIPTHRSVPRGDTAVPVSPRGDSGHPVGFVATPGHRVSRGGLRPHLPPAPCPVLSPPCCPRRLCPHPRAG